MYSKEQLKFLRIRKKRKRFIITIQLLIIISFLIIWQLLADYKLINTFLFSSPKNIFNTLINFNKKELFAHIGITFYETLISFLIASFLGLLIASILWLNKTVAEILEPYLTVINSLPKVALGPLIIIWVGASINSIIVMALMISLILSIINIYNGFLSTDNNYITLLKSFKASKLQIFFKVVIPSNLRNIFNAFKINISMSLIGLLPPVGEKTFFNKCYSRY